MSDADQVAERLRQQPDRLPGQRDGLPPGSLTDNTQQPQGDENREPPPRAPSPPPE